MTINPSDIVLLESERMADYTDGGGRRTSRVIQDGVPGNIFPKVSRLDAVYGRVNLRKVYGAVLTANLDTYAGAHAVITDPPDNDRIHCLLFSTKSEYDLRNAARDRIESYVIYGPESRMILYGRQLVGQMALLAYQRVEDPLPEVGEVFALVNDTTGQQQYVRITDVEHEVRTFTEGSSYVEFTRRVLQLKIGSALLYEFSGPETPSRLSNVTRQSKIRTTTVAEAARYYGILPLQEAAQANDLDVKLPTVYVPIVPTTQRETPVSMAEINGADALVAAGPSRSESTTRWGSTGDSSKPHYLARGAVPGSIVISAVGSTYTLRDNRQGSIVVSSDASSAFGANAVGLVVGTVLYEEGIITPSRDWPGTSHTLGWTPAGDVAQPAHSRSIDVTLATRGTVYVETLDPIPAPGTLIVDYRALGKWYRLRDDGTGKLAGDDQAYGVGTIDYTTGALVITLGALPDVESAILMSWGSPTHFTARAGASADAASELKMAFTLANYPVVPGSVTLRFTAGGAARSVLDATANGTLSGTGASGKINYATGEVELIFTTLPDQASFVSCDYTWRDGADLFSGTAAAVSGNSFTVPGTAPFRNGGTLKLATSAAPITFSAYITSGGQLRVSAGTFTTTGGNWVWADQQVGVFNAATGVATLTSDVLGTRQAYSGSGVITLGPATGGSTPPTSYSAQWQEKLGQFPITGASDIRIERDTAAYDAGSVVDERVTVATAGVRLQLLTTVGDTIIPGSVWFSAFGKNYIDRNGVLYTDVDPTNGSGFPAGSVDYTTGTVSLTAWEDGAALALTVRSCLTMYGDWSAYKAAFRTSGSPIRSGSLYVQVTTPDGSTLTGTSDTNGTITGAFMRGRVVQEMGVVAVEFGEMVPAAGNETEWWYDAALVTGGQIWRPREVLPGTLRYNCVVLSNLPLDSSILGLDPVRLPSDGRVPIFRTGDVAVVHHLDTTEFAALTAGSTYPIGRTNLAEVWVDDATGKRVPPQRYSANLDAGTFTIAADWNAAAEGFTLPLSVRHRIEDLVLLSDVQINGQLSLTAPLSREYPIGSYVSSALLFGDMNARVTNVFDLATFSAWSDTPGTGATAQYNNIDYPIEVLNDGAVGERWRLSFTSTTAFQIIGENLGVIGTGTTGADCSPVNALTGKPYFTLRKEGWGGGWAAGNQLRFNTVGASSPIWISRTILPGATLDGDSFMLQMRGDVDL